MCVTTESSKKTKSSGLILSVPFPIIDTLCRHSEWDGGDNTESLNLQGLCFWSLYHPSLFVQMVREIIPSSGFQVLKFIPHPAFRARLCGGRGKGEGVMSVLTNGQVDMSHTILSHNGFQSDSWLHSQFHSYIELLKTKLIQGFNQ